MKIKWNKTWPAGRSQTFPAHQWDVDARVDVQTDFLILYNADKQIIPILSVRVLLSLPYTHEYKHQLDVFASPERVSSSKLLKKWNLKWRKTLWLQLPGRSVALLHICMCVRVTHHMIQSYSSSGSEKTPEASALSFFSACSI